MTAIETATTGTEADRAEWLAWRREGIGASDVPKILGLSRFATPYSLWAEKTGQATDDGGESEAAEIGTLMEPVIAELYTRRTGRTIERTQLRRTARDPRYLRATLDAVTHCGRVCEWKCLSHPQDCRELGPAGTDELPLSFLAQAHAQMLVAEVDRVDFGVLIQGREFRLYEVEREPALIDAVRHRIEEFWRLVQRRELPPIDFGRECDRRTVAALATGQGPILEPTGDLADALAYLAEQWDKARFEAAAANHRADVRKAELLACLADHAGARLASGLEVKKRVIHVPERTQVVKAHSQIRLSIKNQGIEV